MKRYYCPQCGKYSEAGRFCGECGSTLQVIIPQQEQKTAAPASAAVQQSESPLKKKKERSKIPTVIGTVLLALYVAGGYLLGVSEANDYISQCESRLGGITVNVSMFWFYLILGLNIVMFLAVLFGSKGFAVTGTLLMGAALGVVIFMAINTEEGIHGLSVNLISGSVTFDKDSEFAKALAFNYYGMAELKMIWLWFISLIMIIIGRGKQPKQAA